MIGKDGRVYLGSEVDPTVEPQARIMDQNSTLPVTGSEGRKRWRRQEIPWKSPEQEARECEDGGSD